MGEKKKKAVIFIFVLYDLSCLSQVSVTRLVYEHVSVTESLTSVSDRESNKCQ